MKRSRRRRRRPLLSACQFEDRRRRPVGRRQLAPERPLVSRPRGHSAPACPRRRSAGRRPYYVRGDQSRNHFVTTHLTIHPRMRFIVHAC